MSLSPTFPATKNNGSGNGESQVRPVVGGSLVKGEEGDGVSAASHHEMDSYMHKCKKVLDMEYRTPGMFLIFNPFLVIFYLQLLSGRGLTIWTRLF